MHYRILVIIALIFSIPLFAKDKVAIPTKAKGFSGMVSAKVVSKSNVAMEIKIRDIEKISDKSKAEKPNELEGETITIRERWDKGRPNRIHMKFINNVKVGSKLKLEISFGKDGTFHINELNKDQRELALEVPKKRR